MKMTMCNNYFYSFFNYTYIDLHINCKQMPTKLYIIMSNVAYGFNCGTMPTNVD